jgi:putative redox protein
MEHRSTRSVTAVLDGAPYTTRIMARDQEWLADEPTADGGQGQGPRPHELLLSALASCTAITLRMYADRKQWNVGPIGITVSIERTQSGAQIDTRIHMDIELDPAVPEEQRQRLAQIARSCPVHRTLENPIHLSSGLKESRR